MSKNLELRDYLEFLESLKQRVGTSRYKAASSVNRELILLYHYIGTEIITKQQTNGWGSKVIQNLSRDLSLAFPEMKGFSLANLHNMRRFAELYPDPKILQQSAGELPWYHHVVLMERIKDRNERYFYIQNAAQYGWSRSVMIHQIELNLYQRQGKAITNFKNTLPLPQSDLANQTLKDPYIFDFLSIGKEAHEREIEKSLMQHIQKFLLELGDGFAFVGRQYHLQISNQDFYIDLLFYHLKLRCYIVIELKADKFEPEHAGKMNFYLSAVDDLLKHPSDNAAIGLILCKTNDKVLAEYTLRDMNKAIGLAEYQITQNLPENLKKELPSIEDLENELSDGKSKLNIQNSVEWQEEQTTQKILPEIKDHLDYLFNIYNLCFETQMLIHNRPLFREANNTIRAQMMILMRITDFLRGTELLIFRGYPEQAGTLVASIFELAHTAIYFEHTPNAAKKWLSSNSIADEMPYYIGERTYKNIVTKNCKHNNQNPDEALKVYKQLCWMKHSLPKMQDMIKEQDGFRCQFGPYSDEKSISHAWFSIQHAGALTEYLLSYIINSFKNYDLHEKLKILSTTRNKLDEKGKIRFGANNPFDEI